MIKRFLVVVLTVVFMTVYASAQEEDYIIDSTHSAVTFRIRHFVGEVEGRFNEFSGKIRFDPTDYTKTSAVVTVKVKSIDTANRKRDRHLKSSDFFYASKYPEMRFESIKVLRVQGKTMKVKGRLTIHGITREVVVPVTVYGPTEPDAQGSRTVGFQSEFIVDRDDYQMNNWKADSGILGKKVKVRVAFEAHSNWQE